MDIQLTKPSFRYFECSRCGFKFLKKISESVSGIARCQNQNCEGPCLEHRLKHPYAGISLTDEQALKKLPVYSQIKYYWIKYPKSWEENIKNRVSANKAGANSNQTKMKNASGENLGYMPGIFEV